MNKNNKTGVIAVITSLFLVVFIDGLGQAVMYPILTWSLLDSHSHVFLLHSSPAIKNLYYAIIIGIFFIGWFFGGVFLSDYSDSVGRKKALIICVAGSALGYLFCALAFIAHNVFLLLLGRAIDGFTAGDQPIAQASILDIAPKSQKSRYIGMMMFSYTAGIIAGPMLGGFLTGTSAMFTGMWLSIAAIVLMAFFYQDSNAAYRKIKPKLSHVFVIFKEAFANKRICHLLFALFFYMAGWCVFFLYVSAYLKNAFAFSTHDITFYVVLIGIGLSIGLLVVTPYANKIKNQVTLIATLLTLIAIICTIAALTNNATLIWLLPVPAGIINAVAYSCFIPLFSNETTENRQGWVMGLTGSSIALAAAIGPLLASVVNSIDIHAPMLVGTTLLLIASIALMRFHRKT